MPVCDIVRPMIWNRAPGFLYRYGVGEYWFDDADACDWWILAHTRDGKADYSGKVTNPGPPIAIVGLGGEALCQLHWDAGSPAR